LVGTKVSTIFLCSIWYVKLLKMVELFNDIKYLWNEYASRIFSGSVSHGGTGGSAVILWSREKKKTGNKNFKNREIRIL